MSNLPQLAQIQQLPSLPSENEYSMIERLCKVHFASKLLPRAVDSIEKAITIGLKARELGLPLMQGFSHIHVIEGKPTISAELMMALVYRTFPNAWISVDSTNEGCAIVAQRPGGPQSKFGFTLRDATQAGLMNKDNWRKYPRAMLRSRAISEMCRAVFPDCLLGCSYTPEELGAAVDEEGNVIDVPNANLKSKQVNAMINAKADIVQPALREVPAPVIPIPVTPLPVPVQEPEPAAAELEPVAPRSSDETHSLAGRVVDVGTKHKGKTFEEMGEEDLYAFAVSTLKWFSDEGKKINPTWTQFFMDVEAYTGRPLTHA